MLPQLLSGRVAIITGAGRGLGKAIAAEFASHGAKVVINYRVDETSANQTLDHIRNLGAEGLLVRADVSQAVDVQCLTETTLQTFGQIDILVNNAGTANRVLLSDLSVEEWDHIINVDLRSAFLCTKAAALAMTKRRYGRILFIAGELAHTGGAGFSHVSAAKAGMVAFCKSVARELGAHNILANVVSPGPIRTPLLEQIPREYLEKAFGDMPVAHFGEPIDIARAAVFLSSEQNSFITGQTLLVNGGHYML